MSTTTPKISADEVNQAILNREEIILLDVRTPGEYQRERIAESINIPIDEIAEKVEGTIPDKDKTIYIYCLSGARSDMATDIMMQRGYKKVFSMTNGLLMWRAKQLALVR
jgi:rhodanese-related sulfurtransferase